MFSKKEKVKPNKIKKARKWERYDNSRSGKPRSERAFNTQSRGSGSKNSIINLFFDFRFNHSNKIFYTFLLLLFVGIISVYSSSIDFAHELTGNKYYFLINHLKFIAIGFIGFSFFYFIRIELISKFWWVFLFTSIGLLLYLMILSLAGKAESVNGATRWLEFGSFKFQPSDFAKLSFVIFVSAFLSKRDNHYPDFKTYFKQNLMPYGLWFLFIVSLILIGNTNLGTAMVVGTIGLVTYGASAVSKYHKIGFLILLSVIIIGGAAFAFRERYRMDRIAVWYNYWHTNDSVMKDEDCPNRRGCYYQFNQGIITIGSGGIGGVGLGQSIGKFYFVQTTAGDDSIIGIIAEEWGFLVTSGIILLYFYLISSCINVGKRFTDMPMYYYLLIAASTWIGTQMFIHVGGNIGLIPLTGQTLPFISLGGSSLLALISVMGLILNVSKQRE